jgi:hypothetical protein
LIVKLFTMKEFIKHYFEIKDFLNRVDPKDDEINTQLNKLRVDSIFNAEFLREYYTNDMSLHIFKEDLLNFIFKHTENIEDVYEMKEFIKIVKEKYDEINS